MSDKNISKNLRRRIRVRAKLKRFSDGLRLSVFRSNKHIYAQVIDDKKSKTLVSANDKQLNDSKIKTKKSLSKSETAVLVGELLAQKAKKHKISKVYFDRGSYHFHGRVKSLAQAAQKGGLKF